MGEGAALPRAAPWAKPKGNGGAVSTPAPPSLPGLYFYVRPWLFPAIVLDFSLDSWYNTCICKEETLPGNRLQIERSENMTMERIKTIETRDLCESAKNGGCGECQTSCQSACKTSCGVANQKCENEDK